GEQVGGRGEASGVAGRIVEAGGDFDARVLSEFAPQLKASFERGARRGGERGTIAAAGCVGRLAGFVDSNLRGESGVAAEGEALIEAHLRGPQPQISRAGERRDGDLRERVRLPRRND